MKAPTPSLDVPESRASGSKMDNYSQKSMANNEETKKNNGQIPPKKMDKEQRTKLFFGLLRKSKWIPRDSTQTLLTLSLPKLRT